MKIILINIFLSGILLSCFTVAGQSPSPFMNDANGRPLYWGSTYIAEGSPYFYDDYCFAEITASGGTVYSNVRVKVNLSDKSVIYMTDSGIEMIATIPVRQVKFMSFIYNGVAYEETVLRGVNTPLNTADGNMYQVMEDGKTKLLKELVITYTDNKKYGEATITRTFTRKETLLALFENKTELKKVEKNKISVLALFETRQTEIRDYIEKQKLKCRNEQDIIAVFQYYNSL